jgi:hypothetical protein
LLAQSSPEDVLELFDAAETPPAPDKENQAQVLIRLARETLLFHTPEGDGFARVPVGKHLETLFVRRKAFKDWLTQKFYNEFRKPPSPQALQDAISLLDARAQFDGPEALLHVRVAGHKGRIYLDLADPGWHVAEIDADGWRLISDPPVYFRRSKGMRTLPTPVSNGSIQKLRPYINVGSDQNWVLCASWLLSALRPTGPYPLLILQGEQGSAKSTMGKFLRKIIDPSVALVRTPPREDRDLLIAATNSWVLAYDNLSAIPQWLSDSLCRLATGGGVSTRELYTNSEEAFFDASRPVILNGIDHLTERPDLADRAVILNLPTIEPARRRDEVQLYGEFERDLPHILGGLLDALSETLARFPTTRISQPPRMADFATWATAGELGLGFHSGGFLDAYRGNRADAVHETLESDSVATALLAFMEEFSSKAEAKYWEGSCEILRQELERHANDGVKRSKGWPKTPRGLSGRVRRLKTFLREVGFDVVFHPRGTNGQRLLSIARTDMHLTVTNVTTVTETARDHLHQSLSRVSSGDGLPIQVTVEPSPDYQPSPEPPLSDPLNTFPLSAVSGEGDGSDGDLRLRSSSVDHHTSPGNVCRKCGPVDWEWDGREWVCPKCGQPASNRIPEMERFEI